MASRTQPVKRARMSKIHEYPKIDTLFERGEDFKVDVTRIRRPEFEIPQRWLVTEKGDGNNVRVSLERECSICSGPDPVSVNSCTGGTAMSTHTPRLVKFINPLNRGQMPTFLL